MNEEVKEDITDIMELLKTTSKKEFYRLTIDHELVMRLYNYITSLQKENETYKSRCEKAIPMLKELNIKLKDILKIGIDIKEISDIENILNGGDVNE